MNRGLAAPSRAAVREASPAHLGVMQHQAPWWTAPWLEEWRRCGFWAPSEGRVVVPLGIPTLRTTGVFDLKHSGARDLPAVSCSIMHRMVSNAMAQRLQGVRPQLRQRWAPCLGFGDKGRQSTSHACRIACHRGGQPLAPCSSKFCAFLHRALDVIFDALNVKPSDRILGSQEGLQRGGGGDRLARSLGCCPPPSPFSLPCTLRQPCSRHTSKRGVLAVHDGR